MKICSIKDCGRQAKNGGMCWMHYGRLRRYGDANFVKKAGNGTYAGLICSVPNCGRRMRTLTLCNMHYLRLWKTGKVGSNATLIAEDGSGYISGEGYKIITVNGKQQREHRVKVEQILGHPLPPRANIHHLNGVRTDNRNCNLVVCPDHTYHMLLHKRQRELGYKGPPLPSSETVAGTAALPVCSSDEGERN